MKPLPCVVAATLAAVPAGAATLAVDTGWHYDQVWMPLVPSDNSLWILVLGAPAHFSLTDAFVPGDTYSLTGGIFAKTTVFAGPNDIRATGAPFAVTGWLGATYGKFTTYLAAGTYVFTVTGDLVGGVPGGFYLRADTFLPEPATWATMILGFGLVGRALRRRAAAVPA
ncbi:MAG: PEPxxWA-CTERM sorting domain-containing protein [Thermaurantiacus tibetensis]|uniref:PEPxxWA-CTERM sorting domain-containing protein n=1 Tax=Thermaurantiacus tibetensis TaxID=2759035 RepID=UPI00188FC31F|nr:PEPxxWA-CTERM sorting domain-containing protein [Thermaurantiacus tibetensis]